MARTIDVTDLPEPFVSAIETLVNSYRERAAASTQVKELPARPIGWLKGQFEVPDSFFEPLPDDLQDLFDGGAGRP